MGQDRRGETLKEKRLKRFSSRKIALGLGLSATVLGGFNTYRESGGEVVQYPPTGVTTVANDSSVNVLTWNAQNKIARMSGYLSDILRKNRIDVAMIQEVNQDDAQKLHKKLPGWYINFYLAEKLLQEGDKGGFGNLIMTRQKPRDIKQRVLKSGSLLSKAVSLVPDMASDARASVRKGKIVTDKSEDFFEEQRVVGGLTIDITLNGKNIPVDFITTHITADLDYKYEQIDALGEFIKEGSKDGNPTILGGDLNSNPREILPQFARLGFIGGPYEGKTSVNINYPIDYLLYREEGVLGLGKISIGEAGQSDHKYLLIQFNANQFNENRLGS